MTIFIEISGPLQLKPFYFDSDSMRRYGWLWFAIGYIKVPFKEFCETSHDWHWRSVNNPRLEAGFK